MDPIKELTQLTEKVKAGGIEYIPQLKELLIQEKFYYPDKFKALERIAESNKKERYQKEDRFLYNVSHSETLVKHPYLAKDVLRFGADHFVYTLGYKGYRMKRKFDLDLEDKPSVLLTEEKTAEGDITNFVALEKDILHAAGIGIDCLNHHRFTLIGEEDFISRMKDRLLEKNLEDDSLEESFKIEKDREIRGLYFKIAYQSKGNKIKFK